MTSQKLESDARLRVVTTDITDAYNHNRRLRDGAFMGYAMGFVPIILVGVLLSLCWEDLGSLHSAGY